MARHFRGSSPRLAGARRKTAWELGTGGVTSTQVNATASTILGSGAAAALDGLTVVRTRGLLSFILTSTVSAGDGFVGAFGVCVVSENAFGIGITAVPTPITDVAWDGWFIHQFIAVRSGVATAAATPFLFQQYEIDSKAMRKIKIGDTLVAVLQTTEIGDADMRVSWDSRTLVKLS